MRSDAKAQFQLEADMAAPVLRWMRRSHLDVKPEFSLPWGICDFVGVKFDAAKVQRRLSCGQTRAIGPPLRLHILSRIPQLESGKCISLKSLEKEFSGYVSPDLLTREMHRLIQGNFVRSPRQGFFHKVNGWTPLHLSIVAVELKLSRLSDAVSQATNNLAFATGSYIALPSRFAMRISRSGWRDMLAQRGIGLLAVSSERCWELLGPSPSEAVCNEIVQSHVIERFWRTRGNSP
jgi:hypothetical protein